MRRNDRSVVNEKLPFVLSFVTVFIPFFRSKRGPHGHYGTGGRDWCVGDTWESRGSGVKVVYACGYTQVSAGRVSYSDEDG